MISRRHMHRHGFSLVEMGISLIVLSVLAGMGLKVLNNNDYEDKLELTQKRMDAVDKALMDYRVLHHRLPCPADASTPDTTQNFGFEAYHPGVCTGGAIAATATTATTAIGTVPYRTLELPLEYAYDGWGRRFTYAVDLETSQFNIFMHDIPAFSDLGNITVNDASGNARTEKAVYAIISHGVNGHGAYLSSGSAKDTGSTNTAELENADADATFVMQPVARDATNFTDRYDDIVHYKERWNFATAADKSLVGKGCFSGSWVCVDETKLPNGDIVPPFKVMRYEARNDGAGVAVSTGVGTPWVSINWADARDACQKLDPDYSAYQSARQDYDIISELQWLAIANAIFYTRKNWLNRDLDTTSRIKVGHTDNTSDNNHDGVDDGLAPLESGTSNDGYIGTFNSAAGATWNKQQDRKSFLPGGQVIWDFTGNVWEWTYCDDSLNTDYSSGAAVSRCSGGQVTSSENYLGGNPGATGWYSYDVMRAASPTGHTLNLLPPSGFNETQFTGNYYHYNAAVARAIIRGVQFSTGGNSGPFSIRLDKISTSTGPGSTGNYIGFRCTKPWIK